MSKTSFELTKLSLKTTEWNWFLTKYIRILKDQNVIDKVENAIKKWNWINKVDWQLASLFPVTFKTGVSPFNPQSALVELQNKPSQNKNQDKNWQIESNQDFFEDKLEHKKKIVAKAKQAESNLQSKHPDKFKTDPELANSQPVKAQDLDNLTTAQSAQLIDQNNSLKTAVGLTWVQTGTALSQLITATAKSDKPNLISLQQKIKNNLSDHIHKQLDGQVNAETQGATRSPSGTIVTLYGSKGH